MKPAAVDADPGAAADKLVFEAAPQPMREDYVENAVKFLSHPKVRGSPIVYRRSFLEKKASPPRRSTRPSKESL
ncbi:hypothetical protein C2845_PM09G10080 [Panicum miliaceum]|uniref:Peroxisomal membrane protein PEX14 n=1 Tax=Panicum miliaceum TaxID=4540 RepID=A0A3L6RZG5_PANMI|nr:hypothetical protein C2845_PM09G10080 [Panicum miliaceum]